MKSLSRVRLLATLWTAAYQAPLSMGFSRQEYWSGVPLPSPRLKLYSPKRHRSFKQVLQGLLEKAMAPHSSTLAWKIPWTEEPGRLQSMGSLRVGHDFTFTFHFHALEKEMVIHSSILAWRIPGTGNPGGLPSMGSHRVGHD